MLDGESVSESTKRALLLNADWQPLHFISDIRAIGLVIKGRAEVVDMSGHHSEWSDAFTYAAGKKQMRIPATLRLKERVSKRWKPPRFRKKVLFNRDCWLCQYCRKPLQWDTVTIDHVIPSSRGGETSWMNCVVACHPCNKKKADRTPAEAGMHLIKQPSVPTSLDFWDMMRSAVWHSDWDHFVRSS